MTRNDRAPGLWARLPVTLRAVISGVVIALIGIYAWGGALFGLGPEKAIPVTLVFLALYMFWASGHLPPGATREARRAAFRRMSLGGWGLIAALAFAVTVEAGFFVLFRLTPFPREAFRTLPIQQLLHQGSPALIWATIVTAAVVAGICEEIGFRGYMQQPIESRHGPFIAILISSLLFTAFHLNQTWATPAMLPLIFAAGALLGLLAWASGSLVPGIIGHAIMDVGNFAYWWTGYIGDFTAQPISVTGVDRAFEIEAGTLTVALLAFLVCIVRLRIRRADAP